MQQLLQQVQPPASSSPMDRAQVTNLLAQALIEVFDGLSEDAALLLAASLEADQL
jgi:hypothetical protein